MKANEASPPAPAPSPGPVHTALEDVRACLPLADGRVLAGSAGGVWLVGRDDAVERVWTALEGLPETRAGALLQEREAIWIGTDAGLVEAVLDGARLTVRRTWTSAPVRAIARHDGDLFVATWGEGVARVDRARERLDRLPVRHRRASDDGRMTSLAVAGGALVAGTAGAGVLRLDGGVLEPLATGASGEDHFAVHALAEHGGRLWIGVLEGLWSIDAGRAARGAARAGTEARRESAADVRALAAAGGSLWVGGFGQGLMRHDGRRLVSEELGDPFVQSVATSGRARCVGTRDGLWIARGEGTGFRRVAAPDLPSNDVSAIAIDGARVWAGTFDRGLAVLEDGRWRRIEGVDPKVNAIAIERGASGSRAWIATARGLVAVERSGSAQGERERVERLGDREGLPSADVHAVIALAGGGVLAGTARGAVVVRDGRARSLAKEHGLPPGAVWSVAEGPGGMLLLGTSRGLLCGAPGGEWQRVSMSTGHLRDDWITALQVRGSTVWAGTYNAGVEELAWREDGGWSARHLGGGYVNLAGVVADGDTLYAATMGGLLARPVAADPSVDWTPLASAAPGRDVTAVARAGRDLWVASRRGLVRHAGGPSRTTAAPAAARRAPR